MPGESFFQIDYFLVQAFGGEGVKTTLYFDQFFIERFINLKELGGGVRIKQD